MNTENNIAMVVEKARLESRNFLMEYESKEILKAYRIPTTREALATDINDAIKLAKKIGFPVVLKICSPDIIHKSDVGGVVIGLKTPNELKKPIEDLSKT